MAEFEDNSGDTLEIRAGVREIFVSGSVGEDYTCFFFPPATARAIAAALINAADEAEAQNV